MIKGCFYRIRIWMNSGKRERKYPYLITFDQRPAGFALIERMDDP